MIAAVGLLMDVGNAYVQHQKAQGAADAAASAAAMVLYDKGIGVATSTALYYAAQEGYNNDGVNNTVTVNSPPQSGAYAGNAQYIQVKIHDNVAPWFVSLVWDGRFNVSAAAVAGWTLKGLGAPMIVLEENECQTLRMTGTTIIRVPKGNVHVNSRCADAVLIVGTADITTQTPATIVGGIRTVGSMVVSPPAIVGAAVLPDPLRSLPIPALGDYRTRYGTPSQPKTYQTSESNAVTLEPGVYYGGIKAISGASLHLNPGMYIMAGGGFVTGASSSVWGEGVCIYNTQDPNKPSGDGQAGPIDVAGTGGMHLKASDREGDPYAGILFFQDRDNVQSAHITGASVIEGLYGIVYLPNADLILTGSTEVHANFVVDKLTLTGNAFFTVEGYNGPGWTTVSSSLVE